MCRSHHISRADALAAFAVGALHLMSSQCTAPQKVFVHALCLHLQHGISDRNLSAVCRQACDLQLVGIGHEYRRGQRIAGLLDLLDITFQQELPFFDGITLLDMCGEVLSLQFNSVQADMDEKLQAIGTLHAQCVFGGETMVI